MLQNKAVASAVYALLQEVKVCDPAIGSGAFPMGVLNVLYQARLMLYGFIKPQHEFSPVDVKREIIQNNIYGVDYERGAVDIARLRFWLALVVDETEPEPLPNLDFKIMQGNSLLEEFEGLDLKDILPKKNEDGMLIVFDEETQLQTVLHEKQIHYYSTTDHEKKQVLRTGIVNVVKDLIIERTQGKTGILDKLKNIDLSANDRFFLWHTWFADVFEEGGFDVVIGNPPYIKEGKMSKTYFKPYKRSPYYKGKMDIWYLFACNGLDLLNNKGVLCFIATNNWVTNFGASKLRNKVIKETRICNIVDFGAVMMFESASIQTMIMLFQKDRITDDYSFDYRRLTAYKATEKDAAAILSKTAKEAEYFSPTIRRANFIDKNITFSRSTDILEQIANSKDVIYLYDKEIAQGIVFPQDRLNKKNQQKLGTNYYVGQGVFVLTNEEKDALMLDSNELSLLKPYYTSENVERYVVYPSNYYWAIYTDSKFKRSDSLNDYPKIKAHLDRFISIMTSDNKPYGLHRAREERLFSKEKIVVLRKCVEHPVFSYCNFNCYLSQSFNIIQTDRANMKYLTGLLNSRLIEFWLKNKGKMQGANYQLDKEPLMQIPIAVPDRETQELIARLVDIIILLKSSNQRASNLVTNDYLANEFGHIIDGCVYELYFPDEMSNIGISVVPQLLNQAMNQSCLIDLDSIWPLYSAIDKTGVIESIKSLSLSKSEVLRTIALL